MKMENEPGGLFGKGFSNDAYSQYFIGKSYLNPLTKEDDYLPITNVTFEPGCRNNWHIHYSKFPIGQILICVDGEGWYQEEGKDPIKLKIGDVVEIPSNVKHWHEQHAINGFPILPFQYLTVKLKQNGVKRSQMKNTAS